MNAADWTDKLTFDEKGLIPAIVQEEGTGQILMVAYMNAESLAKTLETGKAHYFSRSRGRLWMKGEESGHIQHVKSIRYDCDGDALLVSVEQTGGTACHTGNKSCFYRSLTDENSPLGADTLTGLTDIIRTRRDNPAEDSYTCYLFEKGLDKMLKKVGEETAEVIIAAKNESAQEILYETADLLYHLSVVLVNAGLDWPDVLSELRNRHK